MTSPDLPPMDIFPDRAVELVTLYRDETADPQARREAWRELMLAGIDPSPPVPLWGAASGPC